MEMYLGTIYTSLLFDDAALIAPSFVGSKVICLFCALTATFLDGFLSTCMEVCLSRIYTSLVFGDGTTCVPSVIGSKVIFWWLSVRPVFVPAIT